MIEILDKMHRFVPAKSTTEKFETLEDDCSDAITVEMTTFHYILMGGDQLTRVRAVGGQNIRMNSDSARDRLQGVVPVTEDWHAKACLLGVRNFKYTCIHLILL